MLASLSGNLQSPRSGWPVRVFTGVLWAALAVCVVFWGLRLGATRALPSSALPALRQPDPADPLAVARVLGAAVSAEASSTVPSGRLVLTGVVAGRSGGGAALIAVDGESPRPFRVGSRVQGDLWLQSVQARQARLGPAPQGVTTLTLDLPALPALLPLQTP